MNSQTQTRKESVPVTSSRIRAVSVGILILLAYSMLTYDASGNVPFGSAADIISGLAVIGIAWLMFPLFAREGKGEKSRLNGNTLLRGAYLFTKIIEGLLMIVGGFCILSASTQGYRGFIYDYLHIYFFVTGALLFYYLLFQTRLVPRILSVWGLLATVVLIITEVIRLFGYEHPILNALLIPVVLNEVVLAIWFMVKGFRK